MKEAQKPFTITDAELKLEMLETVMADPERRIELSESALESISRCRNYLDDKLAQDDSPIYGINTGFGFLYNTSIASSDLEQLQLNLIRSHACGSGEEVPEEVVRLMLLMKVKSVSFGHSGVAPKTAERLLEFYNHRITPVVYTQGSLGASGDLAPLAHLCLPLIGEGEVFHRGKKRPAAEVNAEMGWEPIRLRSKEGLGLLKGTQFMLAYGLHILSRARKYALWADRIAALSLDGFDGRLDPFAEELHAIRPHPGQIATAAAIRELLADSEISQQSKVALQDPYSFRCVPQVHGASRDTLDHCMRVLLTEANSTTDNPNIFVDSDRILSGGNFHGQPLAFALEFMAMAMAELGSMSERRTYQLLSGSRGLPPFLIANPGLHSGLMITQYNAAGLVSQNKQLCTPAVVDTIPSSNGQEDHVSMGANAATKCYRVMENLRRILAIEFMAASQALWFRRPLKTGKELQGILEAFREVVPPVESDRIMQVDMENAAQFIENHSRGGKFTSLGGSPHVR